MDPSMEFGGYVEPPSHLSSTGSKSAPEGRPAELRTVPDYDYSLFRYSKIALPTLVLIVVGAAMLLGLSFWQGPFGFKRGPNGLRDGSPRDYIWNDNLREDAGIKNSLKGLRAANFIMGILPIAFCIFALRAGLTPGILRAILSLCAVILFALGCTSSVSFALGIDEVKWIVDCPDFTFPYINFSPLDRMHGSPTSICRMRENITSAAIVADALQAFSAFILAFLLIYTTLKSNWAWGQGNVPVEKSPNKPVAQFPPPSPFTHIAATRRLYVWVTLFFTLLFVLVAFILMLKLHELRIKPRMVNTRNDVIYTSGWQQTNNRMRVAICGFCIGGCIAALMDCFVFQKRFFSYLIAIFLFWIMVGFWIMFALDIRQLGEANKPACPTGVVINIGCTNYNYMATAFLDFWSAFILLVWLIYEFGFRVWGTWDSFYFYADSEWLRNHSLFVESTNREAFDWKKFSMDTGKEYYYSPSLGISTRARPKNYVEPEGYGAEAFYSAAPYGLPPNY